MSRSKSEVLCISAKKGYRVSALQGDMTQNRRQSVIDGFRAGKYDILVATDIAARGIDVSEISYAINLICRIRWMPILTGSGARGEPKVLEKRSHSQFRRANRLRALEKRDAREARRRTKAVPVDGGEPILEAIETMDVKNE